MRENVLACLLVVLFGTSHVHAVDITGIDSGFLANGGTAVAGPGAGYQVLNAGEYRINNPAAPIDLSVQAPDNNNLMLGHGTALTIFADATTALKVNEFTITGGELKAYGGNSSHVGTSSGTTWGLDTVGNFNHIGGNVTAVARDGDAYGNGIAVHGNYIQDGGVLTAVGGTGFHATGLGVTYDFRQNAGIAYIKAGTGNWANGMTVGSNVTFNDRLVIQRGAAGSDGRALDVGGSSSHTLQFGQSSELTYDLAGAGELPFIRAKKVRIEDGAKVNFINTASVGVGISEYDFIETNYGIYGEFAFPNSAILEMAIEKTPDSLRYTAHFNRTGTAGDLITAAPGVGTNAAALITSLSPLYGTAALNNIPLLNTELSKFDTLKDPVAITAQAERMTAMFTPVDVVSSVSSLATSVNGMASQSMLRNVFTPATGGFQAAVGASSPDALASYACPSGTIRSLWFTPLAQWTRTRPLSGEFSKVRENTYGAGMGFGIRQEYNFAAGASVHYLRSDMNSRTADIDSDVFGFNLFGRKYFANQTAFHPFLEGGVGYSYVDSKQVRKAVAAHSKPDSHVFNGNMAVGIDFLFGNITLTPKLGFDYNHVHTGSYRESGTAGLVVDPDNFDSFRGILGLGVKNQVNDCLYLTANAAYKHEFADRNAVTSNRFTASPDILFVTRGENRSRSSGDIGVGLGWQPRANVLVGVNYDLTIAEKQESHSLALRFGLDF